MALRSIGLRLTIWYTGILTLTFLVLGGIVYGLLVYSLSRDVDYALKGVAEVMIQKARAEDNSFYSSNVDELFQRFFGFSPLDRHIDIFDPWGRHDPRQTQPHASDSPISPKALKNASQGLSTFETVQSSRSHMVRILTAPVMDGGRVLKLVRVEMSLENMVKTRHRFLLIMGAVLPLALLLAGGGGWFLARSALKNVDRMTRSAQRISGEHLDERLQETGSGDELDRLAKTLNDMLNRLDESFQQIKQFSADASHELQTPLTILKGEMEVALRSSRSPVEYQRVLTSGLEEIDRINHLVESLLLLARADAGVLRMNLQPMELKGLLQEVCEQMKVVAESHGISIDSHFPTPAVIHGDVEQLRRVLLNLVDNAIKYTPPGGRVTLTLQSPTLQSGPDWVSIQVSDTGIGLSKDEQQLIFGRFHRATKTRASDGKGAGLGLSIARSIVKAHGGTIDVESTPGQGSTFFIHLPFNPA